MRRRRDRLIPSWIYRGPFVVVMGLLTLTAFASLSGNDALGDSLASSAYLFLIAGVALAGLRYTLEKGTDETPGAVGELRQSGKLQVLSKLRALQRWLARRPRT